MYDKKEAAPGQEVEVGLCEGPGIVPHLIPLAHDWRKFSTTGMSRRTSRWFAKNTCVGSDRHSRSQSQVDVGDERDTLLVKVWDSNSQSLRVSWEPMKVTTSPTQSSTKPSEVDETIREENVTKDVAKGPTAIPSTQSIVQHRLSPGSHQHYEVSHSPQTPACLGDLSASYGTDAAYTRRPCPSDASLRVSDLPHSYIQARSEGVLALQFDAAIGARTVEARNTAAIDHAAFLQDLEPASRLGAGSFGVGNIGFPPWTQPRCLCSGQRESNDELPSLSKTSPRGVLNAACPRWIPSCGEFRGKNDAQEGKNG
ncbi:hypothetical protein BD410DRAFT_809915 [Rickenella mellea]|uniref:Uncharacterized protein n=1 Tax=Rickenella mellea TaxID=50990 RepID=A0A4Y7PGR7_9AGAM|nr:hypothetical protein BD410DRAFT_809915 [Rickenella mellea]